MSTSTTRLGLTKPAAGENYSRSVMNNNSDLIDTYASGTADKMAKGIASESASVSSSGAFALLSVVNNIPTFAFKGGRKYRIIWDASYLTGGTGSLFWMHIATCSTADSASSTSGLTVLNGRTIQCPIASSTTYSGPIIARYAPVSDTTLQVKFLGVRVLGGDLITVVGQAGEQAVYSIFDDGAQY